jgi:hypothetical protein
MRRLLVLVLSACCLGAVLAAAGGSPAGAGSALPVGTGAFVPVAPVRAVDTRRGDGTKVAANVAEVADLTAVGVPDDAVAVALNVTVTEPDADGYVALGPAGIGVPFVSNLNFVVGETTANAAVVAAANGEVQYLSSTSTHVVLDVFGYWAPIVGPTTAGRFTPVGPTRVLDTRDVGTMVGPSGRAVSVASAGVPADATAVAVTLTATAGTAPGYLTAWGSGAAPFVSNVNFGTGQDIANFAIVPLDGANGINVLAAEPTHLVVDVSGYFTGPSAGSSITGAFVSRSPVRTLDTRDGTGRLAPEDTANCSDFATWDEANELFWTYKTFGDPYQLDSGDDDDIPCESLPGNPGTAVPLTDANARVPEDGIVHTLDSRAAGSATAYVMNLTVADPADGGFITAFPAGGARPWASNVNPNHAGHIRPGLAIVGAGTGDQISIYTSTRAHLVADSAGWFI